MKNFKNILVYQVDIPLSCCHTDDISSCVLSLAYDFEKGALVVRWKSRAYKFFTKNMESIQHIEILTMKILRVGCKFKESTYEKCDRLPFYRREAKATMIDWAMQKQFLRF